MQPVDDPLPSAQRQFEAWQARERPPVERVAERLWSIPVPCPFPIRYTSCYLIAGDGGRFILVDPGFDSAQGWDVLQQGIREAGYYFDGLAGAILTHAHADHGSMLRRIPASQTWFGTGRGERGDPTEGLGQSEFDRRDAQWLYDCGVPEQQIDALRWDWDAMRTWSPGRSPDRLLDADSVIELAGAEIRIVPTPGHTAGHLCVADVRAGAILTGDHVL